MDILADLWVNKENKVINNLLSDTFEYADLSFPLAFALNEGIAIGTEKATSLINEAWGMVLEYLNLTDGGFDGMDEMLMAAGIHES